MCPVIVAGHDASLRNAFYNVAAGMVALVVMIAAWHVYLIFQVGTALGDCKTNLVLARLILYSLAQIFDAIR